MKSPTILAAALLTMAGLSGCVVPFDLFGSSGDTTVTIARILTIGFDGQAPYGPDEPTVDVTLEYHHRGEPLTTADVMVEYIDENGQTVTDDLGSFTTAGTINEGDFVRVGGVHVGSGLRLTLDGDVIAQRAPLDVEWFTAQGGPIPLFFSRAGVATYDLNGDSGIEVHATDAEVPGAEDVVVESLDAKASADFEGDLVMDMTSRANRYVLDAELNVKGSEKLDADVIYREGSKRVNAGADVDIDFEAMARWMLEFDDMRELRTIGTESRIYADGNAYVWDEEHKKSDKYEPEEFEHPLVDEKEPYREDDVGQHGESDAEELAEMLRFLNAPIGVGDEYTIDVRLSGFSWKLVVQVVSQEERKVGAGSFQTFRVSQSSEIVTREDSGSTDVNIGKFTYWVDQASGLIVAAQGRTSQTINEDELRYYLGFFGDALPPGSAAPEAFTLSVGGSVSMELAEYDGDLETARYASLVFMAIFGGVASAALGSQAFGGMEPDYREPSKPGGGPPAVVLQANADSANDRILIKHTSGETLLNGTYQVSVTKGASSNPDFIPCTFDLEAGGQLIGNTETTDGARCTDDASGPEVHGGGALTAPATYQVLVRHVPSQSTLLDENIEML